MFAKRAALAVCLSFLLASPALAGITQIDSIRFAGDTTIGTLNSSTMTTDESNPNYITTPSGLHKFWWCPETAIDGVATYEFNMVDKGDGQADTHWYDMSLNGDPIINNNLTVENDSGVAWAGYVVQITLPTLTSSVSNVQMVVPSVGNTTWSNTPVVSQSGLVVTITYGGPNALADLDSATLSYRVTIPSGVSTATVQTDMTPILVPEPASLGLLAVAGLGLLLRRR